MIAEEIVATENMKNEDFQSIIIINLILLDLISRIFHSRITATFLISMVVDKIIKIVLVININVKIKLMFIIWKYYYF